MAVQLIVMLELLGHFDGLSFLCLEFFAGMAAITRALQAWGCKAFAYDIEYGHCTDINSRLGLLWALCLVATLLPGGMGWVAPVCSSWGFLCAFQSGRSVSNGGGDESAPWVVSSNNVLSHHHAHDNHGCSLRADTLRTTYTFHDEGV